MQRYNVCEIDLAAIRHNVGVMKSHIAGGAKFLAVVKADAYGHGAVPVAKAALEAGADMLAVAIPEEGIELRNAGIAAPILVLGGIEESAAEAVVQYNLTQVVFDEAQNPRAGTGGTETRPKRSGASQAGYGHEPHRRAHRGRSAGADAAHRQPERH